MSTTANKIGMLVDGFLDKGLDKVFKRANITPVDIINGVRNVITNRSVAFPKYGLAPNVVIIKLHSDTWHSFAGFQKRLHKECIDEAQSTVKDNHYTIQSDDQIMVNIVEDDSVDINIPVYDVVFIEPAEAV